MALTGNTVQSTYLDLVQLEKSGAGLPSHAGKEAAVYDGSGAQIIGRTAVRHWLDPHPDAAAFAETWEFSTTGAMTQGQLESAGWTFTNCTGVVANGMLILTFTSNAVAMASLAVNFTGDFDVCITPISTMQYFAAGTGFPSSYVGGGGVADYRAGVADVAHYGLVGPNSSQLDAFYRYINGAFTTLGGTEELDGVYVPNFVRVFRYSSTVEVTGASAVHPQWNLIADDSSPHTHGFANNASVTDSSTFNKLFLTQTKGNSVTGTKIAFASIRRFQ